MYDPIHFADTLHRLTRAQIHHQFHIPELPLNMLVKNQYLLIYLINRYIWGQRFSLDQ